MANLPSVYELKPKFQNLLRPLGNSFAAHGVSANQVTVAACLLSVATGVCLAVWGQSTPQVYFSFPVVLFVRMAMNAIDGMLAREHGMKSNLGAILNELTDVISDGALYLPFALLPGVQFFLPVLVVWLAAISEMTGVIGVTVGASRRYDGPMGKSDRAAVFGGLALLVGGGLIQGSGLNIALALIAALIVVTVVNRAKRALSEASRLAGGKLNVV